MPREFLSATALMFVIALGFPPSAKALDPLTDYLGKFFFDQIGVGPLWDVVTGKPNLNLLDKRLKELENNAVMRGEVRDEVRKLRESINERVTRDEFRRMADRTMAAISTIQQRLDSVEERVERLEVENEDLKNGTKHARDAGFFLSRGERYEAEHRVYNAIACYNLAIQLAPTDANLFRRRSRFYINLGTPGVGIADASESVRLDPTNVDGYRYRAIGNLHEKRYDQVIADSSEVIRLAPNDAKAYSDRGLSFFHLNNFDEAIADCSEAIRLDPSFVAAYCTRATAYLEKNDYARTLADCAEAIRLVQDQATCCSRRSSCSQP